jgi:predicted RNA-binding Zn ribbon-like protein
MRTKSPLKDDDKSGGRLPAPPELRQIQEFVNTRDMLFGQEVLQQPADLADWLTRQELLPDGATVTDEEFRYALRVRDAVRRFLGRDRDEPTDLEMDLLDEVGRKARLQWTFESDGNVRLTPRRGGVPGALGTILAPLLSAALTGLLPRLKTCRNCRWVFYDYSKNRSAVWCSMDLCGSRAKAKRYYWRTREATQEREGLRRSG